MYAEVQVDCLFPSPKVEPTYCSGPTIHNLDCLAAFYNYISALSSKQAITPHSFQNNLAASVYCLPYIGSPTHRICLITLNLDEVYCNMKCKHHIGPHD